LSAPSFILGFTDSFEITEEILAMESIIEKWMEEDFYNRVLLSSRVALELLANATTDKSRNWKKGYGASKKVASNS